jgi:hypothetical protein
MIAPIDNKWNLAAVKKKQSASVEVTSKATV